MKKSLLAAVLAVLAAQPSHALFGFGVSYGRNFSSVSSATDVVGTAELPAYLVDYADANNINAGTLTIARDEVSGLQQLGLKAWLDLPLLPIEFEGAANVAWGSYGSLVMFTGDNNGAGNDLVINTGFDAPFPVPGLKSGETPYFSSILDASIRYPFLKLPPLSPLKPFKIYVGGGVSWFYSSKVISKDEVTDIFNVSGGGVDKAAAQAELTKKIKDNFYESTIGGHVLLGAQFKLPVLPIALFADGKWYFNAAPSSAASNYPLAISAGVGLAL